MTGVRHDVGIRRIRIWRWRNGYRHAAVRGLIIFGIVMLVRGFGGRSSSVASVPTVRDKSPLDILGERYARGEIDKTEFEQKRNDLRGA